LHPWGTRLDRVESFDHRCNRNKLFWNYGWWMMSTFNYEGNFIVMWYFFIEVCKEIFCFLQILSF
jgi:hypothetical protein